jgi:hypothetical protein
LADFLGLWLPFDAACEAGEASTRSLFQHLATINPDLGSGPRLAAALSIARRRCGLKPKGGTGGGQRHQGRGG